MKSLPKLKADLQVVFNEFIRLRDIAGCDWFKCISCGQIKSVRFAHASHYYNVGHFDGLRYEEDNCHVSCSHCNTFLHGNLIEYRNNLFLKIGAERFELLKVKAGAYKRNGNKWSRFDIAYKINLYKNKIKELKNE